MDELINRINHDIKKAELRRDSFSKDSQEYSFNHATVLALKTVLFDIKELKLLK